MWERGGRWNMWMEIWKRRKMDMALGQERRTRGGPGNKTSLGFRSQFLTIERKILIPLKFLSLAFLKFRGVGWVVRVFLVAVMCMGRWTR